MEEQKNEVVAAALQDDSIVGDEVTRAFPDIRENLQRAAKYIIYLFAALLPIWFVPLPIGLEFGREITFSLLIVAAAILWLLIVLTSGEIRYQHSWLLYVTGVMLLVWGFSTVFSKSILLSTVLSDATAEKLSSLILGALLMFLVGAIFRSRDEASIFLFTLIFSGGIAAIFTLLQLIFGFSVWGLAASFAKGNAFNVVGTTNGLTLFYMVLLVTTIAILLSISWERWKTWILSALLVSAAAFALISFLVNFRTSWIVLFGSGALVFGLLLRNIAKIRKRKVSSGDEAPQIFGWRYLAITALLSFSIFMLMFQPTFMDLALPAEVSPSFKTTWNISKSVISEGPKTLFLGSGPATFGLEWDSYKDPAVNQTVFWSVRFNQGFSWVSTLLTTVGVLGVLFFVVFLLAAFVIFARGILLEESEVKSELVEASDNSAAAFAGGALVGFSALGIIFFLYPANLTHLLLLFSFAGVLSLFLSKNEVKNVEGVALDGVQAAVEGVKDDVSEQVRGRMVSQAKVWLEKTKAGTRKSMEKILSRRVRFESQWAIFLSSLIIVFLLSLGVATFYWEVNRFRAALSAAAGVRAMTSGDLDGAVLKLGRAISFDSKNSAYYGFIIQARIERVRRLISRASAGENVQQEFQQEVNRAQEAIQIATTLHPEEFTLWRARGALYEVIIPFIPGAERLSADSYRRAIDLSPLTPTTYVDFGRAALAFADVTLLRMNQASQQDRKILETLRLEALREATGMLTKAAEIKPDFAPAHFLLSQVAIRVGDLQSAIRSTENAKLTAPFDVGVAFQLGLLYYQADDLNRAQVEFERAVSINENYSNARYFLGLIYDRRGEKARAVSEFERVAALNPGNQEVTQILVNLRGGRGALDSIVPPAKPPEERREPPVKP